MEDGFMELPGRPLGEGGAVLGSESLQQMARLAWRNNARCIGRLFWNSLHLFDARGARGASEVFEACVEHLRYATGQGKIRAAITVFAEAEADEVGMRIWNRQLIRYAGYRAADGKVLGDPEQVAFTERLRELGWVPPRERSAFDVLPLAIACPGESVRLFTLPKEAVLEVPMVHPEFAWFGELGLKWHAVPAVSDMALVGGGHRFPAAPFSGYFMGTEIGSRNFGDEGRYNVLPRIAERMGLDCKSRAMLWKDRALVEINTAVLHSFREAGVTIVDHHTGSAQFMEHVAKEEACGREVPGDWSWLVPPLSGSICPVFHRYYGAERPEPAFVAQAPAW